MCYLLRTLLRLDQENGENYHKFINSFYVLTLIVIETVVFGFVINTRIGSGELLSIGASVLFLIFTLIEFLLLLKVLKSTKTAIVTSSTTFCIVALLKMSAYASIAGYMSS